MIARNVSFPEKTPPPIPAGCFILTGFQPASPVVLQPLPGEQRPGEPLFIPVRLENHPIEPFHEIWNYSRNILIFVLVQL
jgi:hypothetical protein